MNAPVPVNVEGVHLQSFWHFDGEESMIAPLLDTVDQSHPFLSNLGEMSLLHE